MSDSAIIFNPLTRPVQYTASGLSLGSFQETVADLSDPVCALALREGFLVVLESDAAPEVTLVVPPVNADAPVSDSEEAAADSAADPDVSDAEAAAEKPKTQRNKTATAKEN